MAATNLVPSFEIEENLGCKQWLFEDTAGVYDVTLFPLGYGAPNTESTAITSATISILAYGATIPYIFTFTIASGTITSCTVTAPNGTVTTITTLLTNTVFPFSATYPFVIIADWLGFGVSSTFTSGTFYIEYNVTDGTYNYTTDCDQVMVCSTACCVRNMDVSTEGCGDCSGKANRKFLAKMFIDEALWAMENADVEKSQELIVYAQSLCDKENCNGC